ncbi:MAG: TetR/AcrR family transcriptional regulator [Salinivirgaceae bacterium]
MINENTSTNREGKIDRKAKIMDVALKLFAEEGFYNTSIAKIAKTAGVSKGLMYNYFESKDELLRAVLLETIDTIYVHLDEDRDGTVTEKEFLNFIVFLFDNIQERKVHWQLYTSLVLQKGVADKLSDDIGTLGKRSVEMLIAFFRECFKERFEAELIIFSSLIKGVLIQYLTDKNATSVSYYREVVLDFYKERLEKCNSM